MSEGIKHMSLNKRSIALVIFTAFLLGFIGCSGDTDGGKAADEDFGGTTFVPSDENSGSVSLDINENEIAVSQISGFSFKVRDSNGQPVPHVQVSCDSEAGVAIIEPTTGSEITDSNGQISGKIGCRVQGSFQFACRLPIGGNLRKFADIKCTGDVPSGFDGFPGAAGGGLGTGGVQNPGDGEPGGVDSTDVLVTGITALDDPSSPSSEGDQIDTAVDICTPDDPTTTTNELVLEPFSDTRIKFRVVNNSNSTIRFNSFSYKVPNFDGTGRTFESSSIAFIGDTSVEASGGEVSLSALVFAVRSSETTSGTKFFINSSSGNRGIDEIGFRNVTFTLTGTTALGQTVTVSGRTVFSFNDYNHC